MLTKRVMLQEFCDECEGQSRVVRRNAAFADNATLLPEFQRRAGDGIYAGLREGFRVQYLHPVRFHQMDISHGANVYAWSLSNGGQIYAGLWRPS